VSALGDFLLAGPRPDLSDLDLERSSDIARTVHLSFDFD